VWVAAASVVAGCVIRVLVVVSSMTVAAFTTLVAYVAAWIGDVRQPLSGVRSSRWHLRTTCRATEGSVQHDEDADRRATRQGRRDARDRANPCDWAF
jgi:hypothetical protein